jgi:hypothetical protein
MLRGSLFSFLDLHLAGFQHGGEGLLVAIGDSAGQVIFFGRALTGKRERDAGVRVLVRLVDMMCSSVNVSWMLMYCYWKLLEL